MALKRIFIHGHEGSPSGHKASLLRACSPDIVIPAFQGDVPQRMATLEATLTTHDGQWVIVGSSLGGLMGALWTCRHPDTVNKLILLAPALLNPEFSPCLDKKIAVPVLLFHGSKDDVVPMPPVLEIARRVFVNLQIHTVEDDHRLRATSELLDWSRLLSF